MKPCDCKDKVDLEKLNEQAISDNKVGIEVRPNVVILTFNEGSVTIRVPQCHFRVLAEWYLEDQEEESYDYDTLMRKRRE